MGLTTDFHDEPWRELRHGGAGKASLNRGIAALAVAASGYVLGFVLPWAVSSAQSTNGYSIGRVVFFPIGGIASLMLAIVAISIGRKVTRVIDGLSDIQRGRVSSIVDLNNEKRRASAGIILGIMSIALNPLLAFAVIAIVRLAKS